MQEPLITTTNNLRDIIGWLHIGHIVCIHTFRNAIFYSHKNSQKDDLQKLIYIDLENNPTLLQDDEWPYYIEREGFIRDADKEALPTNPDNIYSFKI